MIDRYTRPEMGKIWTLHNRYQKFLEVEVLACEAWASLGVIPKDAARAIKEKATFTVERINELEKETRHDVVAFTRSVTENLGPEGRFFHFGLTSYDIVDTALSLMLVEAASLIEDDLDKLAETLRRQALEHKETIMSGRTHGVHAEPISLGLKFALWLCEINRHQERLARAKQSVSVGKISGAVGTYAHIDPFVEEYVCGKLGLKPAPISTQILQRDRHGEFLMTLALIASTLDKIATEIRHLQRTEVRELEEPFYKGQKGSSAMPHKRNPVSCEQVSGLARLVRSNAQASLENVNLWHERDISHSSVERVILPDSTILVDYMLVQMSRILDGLHIYPEKMLENLNATGGLVYSQRVLLTLVEKGLAREEAYKIVQDNAMISWEKKTPLKKLLIDDEKVAGLLTPEDLEELFNPDYFLRKIDFIYKRAGII